MRPEVILAYEVQRQNAKRRGIPWEFTLEEWWAWWKIDDNWARRGVTKHALCMCRIGDSGPYSPSNVYCATNDQNKKDMDHDRRRQGIKDSWVGRECHLKGKRGTAHPKSKQVKTPLGAFGSCALAAERHGISRQHAARLAKAGEQGWSLA